MAENGEERERQIPMGGNDREGATSPDGGPPPGSRDPVSRLADMVAAIKVGVHVKLLSGYLIGALLLLGMAILTLVVISSMNNQVEELTQLQDQVESAGKKNNLMTSQLHFRALALLTNNDAKNVKVEQAKQAFSEELAIAELKSPPGKAEFFQRIREINTRFSAAGQKVLAQYQLGNLDEALRLHLEEEREVAIEAEQLLGELVAEANRQVLEGQESFQSDRKLLSTVAWTFSGVSLATALLIGLVMSLAFIRPVRRIDWALAQIAEGDFTPHVEVPNRDEFGTLSLNLNSTTKRLGNLYQELQSLNRDLQTRVDSQVEELERTTRMKRYLSPQLAESILSGATDVDLISQRQELTILFSDIRGFTAMSERIEPEDLVDLLNQYLTEMTEIVFKHGGTLDKYIGDALMVFFGNPVPYDDHGQRAVKTALEMRARLVELRQAWAVEGRELLTMGIGITSGYVTVGNIGSPARMDYTVLGNQVNLASRLADKAEGGQILVSDRTLVTVRDLVDSKEIDQIQLEGVSRPIGIFENSEREATEGGEAS